MLTDHYTTPPRQATAYILLHPEEKQNYFFSKTTRVTRVGEFSSIGRLFTFDSFLKVTEVAQNFKLLFSHGKSYVRVLTKMGWVKFGSIFYKLIWSP
jgi:hypothetical protein